MTLNSNIKMLLISPQIRSLEKKCLRSGSTHGASPPVVRINIHKVTEEDLAYEESY